VTVALGDLIVADGQVQWGGFLLGDNDLTWTDGITGWDDLPGVDSGNVARPGQPGSWPGQKLPQERIVTWSGVWTPDPATDTGTDLVALRQATTILDGTDEQPLVVRTLGETMVAYGAVTNRALPNDALYSYRGGTLALQWTCADPRRYSIAENVASLSLTVAVGGGLTYPLVYPLDYGPAPVSTSSTTATNAGDAASWPLIAFMGPIVRPSMYNAATGALLEYALTLTSTDVLVIDCRAGTVLLNGVDRAYTRTEACTPVASFLLVKGDNPLTLRAQSWGAGNSASVTWRSATL
jgi:hypothetical protein